MLRALMLGVASVALVCSQTIFAHASATETAQTLTAEKLGWDARSARLSEEATALAQMARDMLALPTCVLELTRNMRLMLASYTDCLTGFCGVDQRHKAHWAVQRVQATLQGCQHNQQNMRAVLKNKRQGPPYQEATRSTYTQLVQGHDALSRAEAAIADVLEGYAAALTHADALYRGCTAGAGDAADHVAVVHGKAQKLLDVWHAPRSARLMLVSAPTAQQDATQTGFSAALGDAVRQACDVSMAEHDAHRTQLICGLVKQAGISAACADAAEALCDADNDTWADEQQAVRLLEQCSIKVKS